MTLLTSYESNSCKKQIQVFDINKKYIKSVDVSSFNAINQIIEEKEEYSESSHSDYETSSLTL